MDKGAYSVTLGNEAFATMQLMGSLTLDLEGTIVTIRRGVQTSVSRVGADLGTETTRHADGIKWADL